ncbi:sugar ABC transporter ATP-binding protein [Azospirillum rugosum]|uniref:Ribose transport system ATP-binding protein n=1 Tax=Azospirillum rugosum TaxID=416170 RepID=A0ABS4SSH0_9PROT|nr:sugar ABC transporter ATP-binding protein [Azospirillum rugosum]MBP2295490.1 ribose transport system ATP-binding protein [Azospirillum rugosum]MDQ0528369.1 ribose transport system ATP-binding protein [Azospirillum rugosum]
MLDVMQNEFAPFLTLTGISKRYGGVRALDGVTFACGRGSIHAVLGENGAGKSTLIKIVSGVVQPDEGLMRLDGREVAFPNPAAANRAGVVCVFQELSLMPDLTVADNILAADPPRRFGLIDGRAQRRRAEELLASIGCADVDPRLRVRDLPLSRRQMVEIAKALAKKPRLLILDEATSALTAADVERVYAMLRRLKADGVAILYISHRMHEIDALADTLSVFRNGRHIETFAKGARSPDRIVELMIGREITAQYPPKPLPKESVGPPRLDVRDLSWGERLKGLSFSVGAGEIVGLGGLDGQGQKEVLLALFGVLKGVGGTVTVDGRPHRPGSPAEAKDGGLALIPEDRKTEGLMLPMSIADNLVAASLKPLSKGLVIDRAKERAAVADAVRRLRIKIGSAEDAVSTLSGGNQQKVVIAKWLMTGPGLILLNDPTRGIDVGTKQEIYRLLRDLADGGAAILFYSTDYDELIGCCDRVSVMYDGRIVRELEGDAITEQAIVASALNMNTEMTHHG